MADKEYLKQMAREVDKYLPDNHGFILIAVPYSTDSNAPMTYISSLSRTDAIKVLKSFLFQTGEEENWMKDIR